MIIGAHSIIYSKEPEADRAFLRDVLQLTNVDVGDGWLIFGLPPAEVAVHPSHENDVHEFFLMCEDIAALVDNLAGQNIACTPAQNLGWGILAQIELPGGGKLGVYQPRHARPKSMSAKKASAKKPSAKEPLAKTRSAKKASAKKPAAKTARRTAKTAKASAARRPKKKTARGR
jgi:hypothetical protein